MPQKSHMIIILFYFCNFFVATFQFLVVSTYDM